MQIRVVEQRGGSAVLGGAVRLAGEEGSDALAIEDAQFDSAGRDRLEAGRVEAAIGAQNAEAGAEPLFGMRPAGEHGADQAFGVRPDLAGPAAEPIRRPLGVAPVGAGHMVGVRAVLAAHGAALMSPDALAAMEDLDHARGDPHVDLGADQRVRDRIKKVMDLDVIVEVDPRAPPLRELPIIGGQGGEGVAFDCLEQRPTAQAEVAHGTFVHALHDESDRRVAFSEREECQRAQPPQKVGLRKSDSGLDFRLIARLVRPRRQDPDRVMGRHRPVGAVDLGVVEGGLVDPALQVVGYQKLRRAAEKTELTHVRAGPVRHRLRPGRLGIGEVFEGAEHADENLRLADLFSSSDRRSRSACPNSRLTPTPRRRGADASRGSAAVRIHEADRRSGCSRSPRDGPPGIPPRGSSS